MCECHLEHSTLFVAYKRQPQCLDWGVWKISQGSSSLIIQIWTWSSKHSKIKKKITVSLLSSGCFRIPALIQLSSSSRNQKQLELFRVCSIVEIWKCLELFEHWCWFIWVGCGLFIECVDWWVHCWLYWCYFGFEKFPGSLIHFWVETAVWNSKSLLLVLLLLTAPSSFDILISRYTFWTCFDVSFPVDNMKWNWSKFSVVDL